MNQCDGCKRGLPSSEGIHRDGHGAMLCTADDYMSIEQLRTRFEAWYLAEFERVRAAGTAIDDNGSPATAEALFWKAEDGNYGVRSIHAAWIGWFHGWMDHRNGYGR